MEAITYIKNGKDLKYAHTTYAGDEIKKGMTTTYLGVKYKVNRIYTEKRKSGKRQIIILKEIVELPEF